MVPLTPAMGSVSRRPATWTRSSSPVCLIGEVEGATDPRQPVAANCSTNSGAYCRLLSDGSGIRGAAAATTATGTQREAQQADTAGAEHRSWTQHDRHLHGWAGPMAFIYIRIHYETPLIKSPCVRRRPIAPSERPSALPRDRAGVVASKSFGAFAPEGLGCRGRQLVDSGHSSGSRKGRHAIRKNRRIDRWRYGA